MNTIFNDKHELAIQNFQSGKYVLYNYIILKNLIRFYKITRHLTVYSQNKSYAVR